MTVDDTLQPLGRQAWDRAEGDHRAEGSLRTRLARNSVTLDERFDACDVLDVIERARISVIRVDSHARSRLSLP